MLKITVLDIGTTKISAMVSEVCLSDNESIDVNIESLVTKPSRGIRKGIVLDINEVVSSINDVIGEIRRDSDYIIDRVVTGISGTHIDIIESFGATGVKGSEVTPDDIKRVMESAGSVYVPLDREIMHVIPAGFSVDGESGIKNPLGLSAVRLEAKVQIITLPGTLLKNLMKCCERAGLKVDDIFLEPIASSKAVLSNEEMSSGVVMVDMGGGTTDLSFYRDGFLKGVTVLPVGGNHLTNDLAAGLMVPVSEAERLKIDYGSAVRTDSDRRIEIDIDTSRTRRKIMKDVLIEILEPRVEEIADMIDREIERMGKSVFPCGVVLTGGGALLRGFDAFLEQRLRLPVRVGYPDGLALKNYIFNPLSSYDLSPFSLNINGLEKLRGNPCYTTVAGLLLMEIEALIENGFISNRGGILSRTISYFRRVFSFSERIRIKGAEYDV